MKTKQKAIGVFVLLVLLVSLGCRGKPTYSQEHEPFGKSSARFNRPVKELAVSQYRVFITLEDGTLWSSLPSDIKWEQIHTP